MPTILIVILVYFVFLLIVWAFFYGATGGKPIQDMWRDWRERRRINKLVHGRWKRLKR